MGRSVVMIIIEVVIVGFGGDCLCGVTVQLVLLAPYGP